MVMLFTNGGVGVAARLGAWFGTRSASIKWADVNRGGKVIRGVIQSVSSKFSFFVLTAFSSLLMVPGCTTVLSINGSSAKQEISVERIAFKEAAADVSATKWPKPEKISLSRRLAGVTGTAEPRVSKADAVNAYVSSLSQADEPVAILISDADRHLDAARRLVVHAEAATGAIRPTMSDVAMLERAIADLRQCREIYVAAVKILPAGEAGSQRVHLASLRADFGQVIRDIGVAADTLADKAADDETKTFAGPLAPIN